MIRRPPRSTLFPYTTPSDLTHSLNGSVATGERSSTPVAARTACRSASTGSGVIRSTMVVATDTCCSSQPGSDGSTAPARSRSTAASTAPLSGRLSQGTSVSGPASASRRASRPRSEEHTSELQSRHYLVCRLLLEKKNINANSMLSDSILRLPRHLRQERDARETPRSQHNFIGIGSPET